MSKTLYVYKTNRAIPRSKYIVITSDTAESVYTPSLLWVNDITKLPVYKPGEGMFYRGEVWPQYKEAKPYDWTVTLSNMSGFNVGDKVMLSNGDMATVAGKPKLPWYKLFKRRDK